MLSSVAPKQGDICCGSGSNNQMKMPITHVKHVEWKHILLQWIISQLSLICIFTLKVATGH